VVKYLTRSSCRYFADAKLPLGGALFIGLVLIEVGLGHACLSNDSTLMKKTGVIFSTINLFEFQLPLTTLYILAEQVESAITILHL
jgi:hypothetical protein